MRALLIHASKFSYRVVRKAVRQAEDLTGTRECLSISNALIAFISVEKEDCNDVEGVTRTAAEDIANVYRRVKASYVIIYPYAHLSRDLATPECAVKVLKSLESKLSSLIGAQAVSRAPFGWYKSFTLSCYGHPLSELSRSYAPPLGETPTIACSPRSEGTVNLLKGAVLEERIAKRFKEVSGRFGLGADALGEAASAIAKAAFENAFSALAKSLGLSGSELTGVESLDVIAAKDLGSLFIDVPARISLAGYVESALLEKGACVVRNVDIRTAFKDLLLSGGLDRAHFLVIKGEELWDRVRASLKEILAVMLNRSELAELQCSAGRHSGSEADLTSSSGRLSSLSEAVAMIYAARVGSTYVPVSSAVLVRPANTVARISAYVPGPLKRFVSTAIARAAATTGGVPSLHTCISPIQAYVIPVSEAHLDYALKVADALRKNGIRVVADFRDVSLGRRIRRAGRLWVPYIVVVGDREAGTGTVNVRIRRSRLQISMSIDELIDTILKDIEECVKLSIRTR